MHLIATVPGGWNPNEEGVFYIEQKPGDIVFLTAADTEIRALNTAYKKLQHQQHNKRSLPSLRMANLVYMKQELTIDNYTEDVLQHAKLIICRLLGGRNYYPYLVQTINELIQNTDIQVIFLPGYEPDIELLQHSTPELQTANTVWKYFETGGIANYQNCLKYLFKQFFSIDLQPEEPHQVPEVFLYDFEQGIIENEAQERLLVNHYPNVVILSYRAHFLSDNLEPLQALAASLKACNINPLVMLANNLRDKENAKAVYQLATYHNKRTVNAFINTTSFAIKSLAENEQNFIFQKLDVPVIQAIFASSTKEVWQEGFFGLNPVDVAMNVSLPEVDGRIIARAVSFKSPLGKDPQTDSDIVKYEAHDEGIAFVSQLAKKYVSLQQKSNAEKHIAVIMPNYPSQDSRMANGVGLDTPESCVRILHALYEAGYDTGGVLPQNGNELMNTLGRFITNAAESLEMRPYQLELPAEKYLAYYQLLSETLQNKIDEQWGSYTKDPWFNETEFIIPGIMIGNIFVSLQPARGYGVDPQSAYHSPDLPPTHQYMAYYFWLFHEFKADAVIHAGKHGNLEWLPGKSIALSEQSCFPAALFPAIPHFYPFIINDPGEGAQAKRRTHAVIIDHLIPPMTRAETYGNLAKLEHLVDEYYEAMNLDPKRSRTLRTQIQNLVKESNLTQDLQADEDDIDSLMVKLDGYLCELKEAQIRDGLHIFGVPPQNEQLLDLLIALHRVPAMNTQGITQALAQDMKLDFDPLNCNYEDSFNQNINGKYCRTKGQATEELELTAREKLSHILQNPEQKPQEADKLHNFTAIASTILHTSYPKVLDCKQEITHILKGLQGRYIPSGPAGAPTRGRHDLLPTGRNFFSVDIRTVPTETAYLLGTKSANLIIEKYMQEHGDYPETIGISVWGTATMRTGGDDIAQALALLGVKPVWQKANRKVTGIELIPLMKLGRPRVDVTLRISGFFRDAFPDIISLFNEAVELVARQDEPTEENPVRKRYLREKENWLHKGLDEQTAENRALYRVFGSKPGAYGAGLQHIIENKNWESQDDLAQLYVNWSGYAYGKDRHGASAHETFYKRLADMQIVMQNQDNREHDILDADDYYQFQGGMANAVKASRGDEADIYFGDHARPENPKVKTLKEELLKVYRSRVINPKWIEGVKRHGYKGAFEMAATMDYMFAYDATTNQIDDFMYEGISQSYLIDEENRKFLEENNPWALKDMSERMLEAIQRGMWQNPSESTKEQLKNIYLQGDALLEEK